MITPLMSVCVCVLPLLWSFHLRVDLQDHSIRCCWRPQCDGHEQVTWCLHHRRLPAEERHATLHPRGTTRRGRVPQCECVVQWVSGPVGKLMSPTVKYSTGWHKSRRSSLWLYCKIAVNSAIISVSERGVWTYFMFMDPQLGAAVHYFCPCVCFLQAT